MPGVRKAKVDFDAKEVLVTYNPRKVTVQKMIGALEKAGFKSSFKRWPKKSKTSSALPPRRRGL